MKGKRTGVEFDKHELFITKSEGFIIHDFKKPDTVCGRIKFINTNGVLVVIGDYGHWMFCREFHPSSGEGVSEGYWLEKCDMDGEEFDPEETQKELKEKINGGLAEYGYEGEKLTEAIEFFKDCLTYSDNEWEYVGYAHGRVPGFMDHEEIPHAKRTKQWLRIIFDAFDEICRRESATIKMSKDEK